MEESILRTWEAEGPGREMLSEGAWQDNEANWNSVQIMLMHTSNWWVTCFSLVALFPFSQLSKENGNLTKPKLYENSADSLLLAFCFLKKMLSFLTMRKRLTSFFLNKTLFRRMWWKTNKAEAAGEGWEAGFYPALFPMSWILQADGSACPAESANTVLSNILSATFTDEVNKEKSTHSCKPRKPGQGEKFFKYSPSCKRTANPTAVNVTSDVWEPLPCLSILLSTCPWDGDKKEMHSI